MNGDGYSRGSRQGSSRDPRDYNSRDDRRDRDRGDRERDRPRRRSRSPGNRGSRRDYDGDTYTSSRGYREREREDRFGERDRRGGGGGGDREWDRDRGYGRRDQPRRDDAPPRRDRDRDLFDDRRGGGGGRKEREQQQPRRSPTPPRKPKEPTPDLTEVTSILQKRRRLTQWDIKPPGYERITAEQAKISGMFPLPGAPRQQPMDPSRLQAFMDQPASSTTNEGLKPENARQAKRMFVSNLPSSVTDASLQEFFNLQMNGLNIQQASDPCLSAQVSKDRTFALLEFKSAVDATFALALDGIAMEDVPMNGTDDAANGKPSGLVVKRPKDYIAPDTHDEREAPSMGPYSDSPDTQAKVCITRLPVYIDDAQVQELLAAFGPLKNFVLVKDRGTEQSRGVAYCEYVSWAEVTDSAIASLNGMELADSKLRIIRACVGTNQLQAEMSVSAMSLLAGNESGDLEESRVLCLLNMVTAEELLDNDEYEEIVEDVREECSKYGAVEDIKVPRPAGGSRQSNGVGKIYLKYDTIQSAAKALRALAGRKFADRTVVVTYFGEAYFDVGAW